MIFTRSSWPPELVRMNAHSCQKRTPISLMQASSVSESSECSTSGPRRIWGDRTPSCASPSGVEGGVDVGSGVGGWTGVAVDSLVGG